MPFRVIEVTIEGQETKMVPLPKEYRSHGAAQRVADKLNDKQALVDPGTAQDPKPIKTYMARGA